jgi:hypothetical protein
MNAECTQQQAETAPYIEKLGLTLQPNRYLAKIQFPLTAEFKEKVATSTYLTIETNGDITFQ